MWNRPYPQVLSSCRLLNSVGKDLLVLNKTVSVVYHYQDCACECGECEGPTLVRFVAGESSIAAALRKYPGLQSAATWSISIVLYMLDTDLYDDYTEIIDGLPDIQSMMWEDVRALQSLDHLSTLFIELKQLDAEFGDQGFDRMDLQRFLCNPFRALRAQYVDTHLPSKRLETKLVADITSQTATYDMLANKARINRLLNSILKHSDCSCWTGYDILELSDIAESDPTFVPDARMPTMQEMDQLESVLEDLSCHWRYWEVDDIVDPILQVLSQLGEYFERASQRVDGLSSSRPVPRWVARITRKLQKWREEIDELVEVHEALRRWYTEIDGQE